MNEVICRLNPIQAAFIEYMKRHPHFTFERLKVHEGVPIEAQITTGMGVETVRFDKIARDEGLLK